MPKHSRIKKILKKLIHGIIAHDFLGKNKHIELYCETALMSKILHDIIV